MIGGFIPILAATIACGVQGISLRRSGCPPCQDYSLISASAAKTSDPCGCGGSGGLTGLSSESDLEAKTTEELEKILEGLGSQIQTLDEQLTVQTEKQTEQMLAEKQRLSDLNSSSVAKANKTATTRAALQASQSAIAANISSIEAEGLAFGQNASEARAQRSNLTLALSSLVAHAASQCTSCSEVILVENKLGLSQYGPLANSHPKIPRGLGLLRKNEEVATTLEPSLEVNPRVLLIRKVMAAEEKVAVLKKELEDGVMRAAEERRSSLDAFDKLKSKMARQDIDAQQAFARLADRSSRLESQMTAALAYRVAQEAAYKKVQEDVAALESDFEQLKAAMTLCGCY
mmetsp:Transcript_505/g.1207  ORF Transcript_505/g.1207 Transcript_505/m.1207 type:complete len:346 (-) Transcript_505:48-1085(-)